MQRKQTIHVSSWEDLKQFGINALTGEACKYAQRILCDLNEDGAALIMDYLGVSMLRDNWNSTVNDKPAVASVMLHRGSCMQLAEFAILGMNPLAVLYRPNDSIYGIFDQKMVDDYAALLNDW